MVGKSSCSDRDFAAHEPELGLAWHALESLWLSLTVEDPDQQKKTGVTINERVKSDIKREKSSI